MMSRLTIAQEDFDDDDKDDNGDDLSCDESSLMTTMIGRTKFHKIKNPNIFFTNLHVRLRSPVWIPFIHYDYPPAVCRPPSSSSS